LAGFPQRTQNSQYLSNGLGQGQQLGDCREWAADVIGVETGDDHLPAAVGQRAGDLDQVRSHEVRFVTPTTSVRHSIRFSMSLV
jgi:hypothetical protein